MTAKGLNNEGIDRPDLTLPRNKILRGRKQFKALFEKGSTLHGKHINLRYRILKSEKGEYLMAFITAKRLGKAAERNKIKRRMREAYRQNQRIISDYFEKPSSLALHGALIAKNINADFNSIEEDVIQHLKNIRKALYSYLHKVTK